MVMGASVQSDAHDGASVYFSITFRDNAMTTIIAGRLQEQDQIQQAIAQLAEAGFAKREISSFYVSPPGRHDVSLLHNERIETIGTREVGGGTGGAVKGAVTGGVIGTAVGAAGTPLVGPISTAAGALLGAYVGSLVGAVAKMKEKGEAEADTTHPQPQRRSGMMIAVCADDAEREQVALAVLRRLGADQLERTRGTISDSEWKDFDPLAVPNLVTDISATRGSRE